MKQTTASYMLFIALTGVVIFSSLVSYLATYLWYKFVLKVKYTDTKVKLFVELASKILLAIAVSIIFVPFGLVFSLFNGIVISIGILFPILLSNSNLEDSFNLKKFLLNFALRLIEITILFVLVGVANSTILMPFFL